MIRSQHQAWSERLASRASLLQSTISHDEPDSLSQPSTTPRQHPPVTMYHHDRGGALQREAPPPSTHGQDEGVVLHHQAPPTTHGQDVGVGIHQQPSVSMDEQDVGGAMHQHPTCTNNLHVREQKRGGANYSYLPASSVDQDGGGARYNSVPPTTQHESLSIYTLSTRYYISM